MIEMQTGMTSLESGMKEFIVDCKIRNLAQDTLDYYNESFHSFMEFINKSYENFNVKEDIRKKTIDNYILYMQEKKLKDTTINIKLRGIRRISYYFTQQKAPVAL